MIHRRALLAFAAGLAGLTLLRAAPGHAQRPSASRSAVRVTREEPIVERMDFDPQRPPRGMPALTPPESGVCKTTFELSAGVSYSAERLSPTTARIYVDELDIVTRLRFDIFTIENAPPKLRAHEEGHRAIGEHYYEDAARIAGEIGRRLIGATFEGRGADAAAAQRDGFNKVVAEIERAYMARVRIPSAAANERFDEITNHGLNPIDEAEAVALAVAGAAGQARSSTPH
ncbi:MAG: hypothetical protein EHM50_10265 [Lysobacterales bacterium]|nr:MAG: hypothetical protein EHM50_10265 [Xanthomonadales bacterium]